MNEAEKWLADSSKPKDYTMKTAGIGWRVFVKDGSAICTSISYSDNWDSERYFVGQVINKL